MFFQCPEAVVDLYNGVLDHLEAVMTSQHLCSVSWPVQEFSCEENGETAFVIPL